MRIVVIVIAVLAVGVALYVATVRAFDRSMHGLFKVAQTVTDSVKFREEYSDAWSPILWRGDTIGKLVTVAGVQYGSSAVRSMLIYRGLLTGRPPTVQPDSLVAIDSSDNARFAHELRLVPMNSVSGTRQWLGTLHFPSVNDGIRVVSASGAPGPTRGRSNGDKPMSSR